MRVSNIVNLSISLALLAAFGLACTGIPQLTPQQQTSTAATPVPTATPDPETAKLNEKIAELEKKIDSQQKQTVPIQVKPNVPIIRNTRGIPWANSPRDGFLALRSEPSSEIGYRILQIPHGANISVLGCQGNSQRVGGRSGHWCRVSYGGTTGWAFDAWISY